MVQLARFFYMFIYIFQAHSVTGYPVFADILHTRTCSIHIRNMKYKGQWLFSHVHEIVAASSKADGTVQRHHLCSRMASDKVRNRSALEIA